MNSVSVGPPRYRQALYQMQQGLSDRATSQAGLMGRQKAAEVRCYASVEGWLKPGASLPDDATLDAVFNTPKPSSAGPASSLESHREQIRDGIQDGINGRASTGC